MTCENCIHYDLCNALEMNGLSKVHPKQCGFFNEKYRYIELPCKIGDAVWIVYTPRYPANPSDKGKWFMREDGVQRLIYGAKGISIETWNMGTISAKEIGKKLFFTKEEAEKALAERSGR